MSFLWRQSSKAEIVWGKHRCLDGTCVYVAAGGGPWFVLQDNADSWPRPSHCWAIKNFPESHTHKKAVGGGVCYWESVKSKGCSNQLRPLDESQDEEIFLSTAHYCKGPKIKNTHIEMPSTTANDGASLSLSVMEVVENFGLEAKIVGITSDGGGNLRVCREALESKYTNDSVFPHPIPYSPWSALHIY